MMDKKTLVNTILVCLFWAGIVCLALSGIIYGQDEDLGIPVVQLGPTGGNVVFTATDAKTQEPLEGVTIYIDDTFAGTSGSDGSFVLHAGSYPSGTVTIRATKAGYKDHIRMLDLNYINAVDMEFETTAVYPVLINGPSDSTIDIVFMPSPTSFNGTTKTKLQFDGYPGGREQFASDVSKFINRTFKVLPTLMSANSSITKNSPDKFNFYYYWDGKTFGDAFDGCAGMIPEKYWEEVTFSDMTILLYPTYYGHYVDPASQPIGCTNANGPGSAYLKVAANQYLLGIHETGHGLFGLMDTYCGNTYYDENHPEANIWSSEARCRQYAVEESRNPDLCRQISDHPVGNCRKNYWRWDPDPDLMKEAYSGRLGEAATERILSVLDRHGGG